MHTYLLLLHETPADTVGISPSEMREVVERYSTWARGLAERGLLVGAEKLAEDGGQHLRLEGDRPVAIDGPYAEARDLVGGFFLARAADDAAARALAETCPHLGGRNWIEIRRVEPT